MTNSAFWDKHAPMLVAAVLALTTIVCAPPRSYAQTGECCAQTQTSVVSCKTTGCSGTLKYQSRLAPTGDNSTLWKIAEVKCCTSTYTAFTENTGQLKDCDDLIIVAAAPTTAPDEPLYGVWVRTCSGRYVYTFRPVAG